MSDGGPTTAVQHDHDAPTVGVSIHSTEALLDRNGRAAERSLARYIGAAFDRAELNYEIDHGHPPKDPPSDVSVCGDGSTYGWWRERVEGNPAFPVRKDSNILLCDANGGGCAHIGENTATAPGMNIGRDPDHQWIGRDDYHRNLFGTLHELGHNLGFKHSPHPGKGWNEDGEWHRTITVSANDEENLCGEFIERREHVAQARHMYFHDCAVERMRISDADPLGPEPWERDSERTNGGPLAALSSAIDWLVGRLRALFG